MQEQQGYGFIEALKWLAKKYGIDASELERNDKQSGEWKKQARLAKIMSESQRFFKANLHSPAGKDCLNYLKGRGFSDEFIEEQGFGYALGDQAALYKHLTSLGYHLKDLEMCSLASRYDNGRVVDFFINRALVPIRETSGKLIAFGGRALDEAKNKYKNSKYDKASTLFGLFHARKHIRKKSRAIVCEGYMDVLQLWNFGFREAVACQGTALTANHMRLLKMSTKTAYLLFDGDNAGRNASLKAVSDALNTPEVDFRVVSLPEGQDPDSFVSEQGPEALEKLFTKSIGLIEFALAQKLTSVHQSALPELIGGELLPWVSKINDQLKQNFLINKIADLTGFSKNRLGAQLMSLATKLSKTSNRMPVNVHDDLEITPLQKVEKELFGHLFLASPDDLDLEKVVEFVSTQLHLSHPWDSAFETTVSCLLNGESPHNVDVSSYPSFFENSVAQLIDEIVLNQKAFDVENKNEAIDKLFLHRKKTNLQKAISDLKSELATSSLAGDDSWKEIASAISNLQSELIQLN